ncbi:ATP-binding protein [Virgibacillus sp. 6R]|uniref:sensor histidine kinase n=1 Tax=Metabacillus sp. 22489 TaxID=3453928 RepID=UPI00119F2819
MKRKKTNVFHQTERTLTLRYSFLILLFLFVFIILLYSIVYFWLTADIKKELRDKAQHELQPVEKYLTGRNDGPDDRRGDPKVAETDSDQLFYYVTNTNGDVIIQDAQLPLLHTSFIHFISEWQPTREELRREALMIDEKLLLKDDAEFATYVPTEAKLQIFMIAKPIYERNQLVGYLYIGHNATNLFQLLSSLLQILAVIAFIFSGIAFSLSRIMSKRAMVPIKQAFARQQEFVADASHELRTPLSVMLSSIELLEMEEQTEQDKEMAVKTIHNLKEEVKRMTGLVSNLLTLARSDSAQQNVTMEAFDLYQVAKQTIHTFEAHAHTKNITLQLKSPNPLQIIGNIELLTQLLYILIDNAIKYSEYKGTVTLAISKEGNQLLLTVTDNGVGIEEKHIPHLFKRFYRVDKARTRQEGGYGLGLSIAKWIVDTHNGTINVQSKLHEGSTFIVNLPQK